MTENEEEQPFEYEHALLNQEHVYDNNISYDFFNYPIETPRNLHIKSISNVFKELEEHYEYIISHEFSEDRLVFNSPIDNVAFDFMIFFSWIKHFSETNDISELQDYVIKSGFILDERFSIERKENLKIAQSNLKLHSKYRLLTIITFLSKNVDLQKVNALYKALLASKISLNQFNHSNSLLNNLALDLGDFFRISIETIETVLKYNRTSKNDKLKLTRIYNSYHFGIETVQNSSNNTIDIKKEDDFLDYWNIPSDLDRLKVFNDLMMEITYNNQYAFTAKFEHFDGKWAFKNTAHGSSKNIRHAYLIRFLKEKNWINSTKFPDKGPAILRLLSKYFFDLNNDSQAFQANKDLSNVAYIDYFKSVPKNPHSLEN